MFKLIFGLFIVGLIVYVIYQVRAQNDKYKNMQGARDRLAEVNDEIDVVAVKSDVQDAEENLHKRSTKLNKRANELSEKQESDKE